ncbi:unnamed protein product [Prunus brigantina]
MLLANLSDMGNAFDTSPCMACMAKPPFQPKEPPFSHIEKVSIYGWPNIPNAPRISPCMACAWPRKNYSR